MNSPRSEITVTGVGLVCSLGTDAATAWAGLLGGATGISPLTEIESALSPNKGGGQAPELPADPNAPSGREAKYLSFALDTALRNAGIGPRPPYAPTRCGVVLGTTLHGMRRAGRYFRTGWPEDLRGFLASEVLEAVLAGRELRGPAISTCSACSSGVSAINLAASLLEAGELDLVVAGGYDPLSEYAYGGFNALRLIAAGPAKPFARDREGMKLGEGYGVLVLERAADARARGAPLIAGILGFGESADAHHLSQPHPEGAGAAQAMRSALAAAGVRAEQIGLIVAHATATPDNDGAEHKAMSAVFGPALAGIPVTGLKSRIGHTLGGAGAVELILGILAMRNRTAPAIDGTRAQDVEFTGFRPVLGKPCPITSDIVLATSLGFGGSNACIVVGPAVRASQAASGESAVARPRSSAVLDGRDAVITGIGVVVPGAVGNEAFVRLLSSPAARPIRADTGSPAESELLALLNARRVRRMSDYVKLLLAAATVAYRDAAIDRPAEFGETAGAILGTVHGAAGFCETYYREIVEKGVDSANPLLFAEGVPNAGSAHLSMTLGLRGACQTLIGSRTAGLDALALAATRINSGLWDRAVVGAADEYSPLINEHFRHRGLYSGRDPGPPLASERGFVSGAGAVMFVLESRESARRRGIRVRAAIGQRGAVRADGMDDPNAGVAAAALWDRLGRPGCVVSTANGSRLDRLERAAWSPKPDGSPGPLVSTLYGRIAECYSASAPAAIAAALLTGRPAGPVGPVPAVSGFRFAVGNEPADDFAAFSADPSGAISGLRVQAAKS